MADYIELPMVPLKGLIVFPHTILPLVIGRDKSVSAIKEAISSYNNKVFFVAQKNENEQEPKADDIFTVGTIANIIKIIQSNNNTVKVVVEGIERAKIESHIVDENTNFYKVRLSKLETYFTDEIKQKAYNQSLFTVFDEYAQIKDNIPSEIIMSIKSITEHSRLIDIIIANLDVKLNQKQHILELSEPFERMESLLKLIQSEIEILKLGRKITDDVKTKIDEKQKKFYLNEQIEVIKKELGTTDDSQNELNELKKKIKAKKMPKDAENKAFDELKKLKYTMPMSAEATVIRNYLDWLLQIPWSESSKELINLKQAQNVLNEDHYGIEDVKERILEYLAVKSLTKSIKGSVLCLVGPPGVGKTSLAKSIARATKRAYVKLALGGVKDEAEIRGHRRTYIGAMPGGIIQSLKKAGINNPLFLLDEIDKITTSVYGDPSSAFLEVLDPEQNTSFHDHYLDLDYDLSNVFFVATANNLQNIPYVLRDRLEIITLSGYTTQEKFEIAKRYLIKKEINNNGLNHYNIIFDDEVIYAIINNYTSESGVRDLERQFAKILRKVAKKVLVNNIKKLTPIKIGKNNIEEYLGIQKYFYEQIEEKSLVGVASGLAWTNNGGDILKIEVMVVKGRGNIELTGKLGEVMRESAKAALTYVRGCALKYNLPEDFYENNDIHIHIPDGAIPKDGPSAGITISTALLSAFTKKPIKNDVAMTGEITLRGFVLPIGGLKEKLLAAKRSGIKKVIIPRKNINDLKEISNIILSKLEIIPIDTVEEAWHIAIENL